MAIVIDMYRRIINIILTGFLLLLVSCGISNENAKKEFVAYLKMNHKNKYNILTFKRNFNKTSMNPNLFWVELELKKKPNIIITFEWNAKNKALQLPYLDSHYQYHIAH